MTRATSKPVIRKVLTGDDRIGRTEMVAEVRDRTLTLRPLHTRKGGPQEVEITFGGIYLKAMSARVDEQRRAHRRRGA